VNSNDENAKPYDLEERTAVFAEQSRSFVKRLPRTIGNIEDAKQFIRASGSIGANYIEANEAIGRKDFVMKIKICRREAKETCYWLRLLDVDGNLDSKTGEEIMALFESLYQRGHTIILVTHEADIARHARRTVHLRDGLIESDGGAHILGLESVALSR